MNSDPEGITQSECYKFHQTRWEDAVKNSMQYNSSLSEAPLHPIPNVLENKVEKAVKTGTDKNAQSLDCLSTPIAWDGINSSVKKPKASSNLEISKRENANEIKMVKEAPKIGNQHKQESSPRDGSQSVPKPKLTTKPVVISVNRNSAKMADEDGGWKVVVKSRKCKR